MKNKEYRVLSVAKVDKFNEELNREIERGWSIDGDINVFCDPVDETFIYSILLSRKKLK